VGSLGNANGANGGTEKGKRETRGTGGGRGGRAGNLTERGFTKKTIKACRPYFRRVVAGQIEAYKKTNELLYLDRLIPRVPGNGGTWSVGGDNAAQKKRTDRFGWFEGKRRWETRIKKRERSSYAPMSR